MKDFFVYLNQYDRNNLGYVLETSSSMFTNLEQKRKDLEERIISSDICIIDITKGRKDKLPLSFILELLKLSIVNDKKIILIHHTETQKTYIKAIKTCIKRENLLGIFPHDGENIPHEIKDCLDTYYAKDTRYQRNTTVKLESNKKQDIFVIIMKWIEEKEITIGSCSFFHIYISSKEIRLNYEGYNTLPLCTLTIDISSLSLNEKNCIENQLYEKIPESGYVFIHGSISRKKKIRQI